MPTSVIHGQPFDLGVASQVLPVFHLCSKERMPTNRPPRLISAMAGATTLESSFSGITYHLANAGMESGMLEGAFSLYSAARPWRELQVRGLAWKLRKTLLLQKSQGFKFAGEYGDSVWPRYMNCLAGTTVINNFQLFGHRFFERRRSLDISAYYYIDGTLAEYFETYSNFDISGIDASTKSEAMKVEKDGYGEADGIVVMSRRSALSLQEQYDVPATKIVVIPPGANLPDAIADAAPSPSTPEAGGEFILGFVGLYPMRKGLDRLAAAVGILRSRGLPIRLRVIGNCPPELIGLDGLEYLGMLHKGTDIDSFVTAISSVHLGCLPSRAELAGIAMLEFLRLGVPILGTDVGGATDILSGGGSIALAQDVTGEEIAERIAELYNDPSLYLQLKAEATSRKKWASWQRVVHALDGILPQGSSLHG